MKKIFFIFFIFLISCTNGKKDVVLTEQDMYNLAMNEFKDKMYRTAGESFEKIEEQFIFTPIATKSIIMSIYSYYKANKYNDSLRLIDYYKKINFDDEYLDYVFYMEILNKYSKIQKSKKDISLMRELLANINNFAVKDTKYREDILKKRKLVIDDIVDSELNIYDFYIKSNNLIGAINHLQNIIYVYPDTKYTPEILYKLSMLYSHIGYKEGVDNCVNIIKENYKNTKWYKYVAK